MTLTAGHPGLSAVVFLAASVHGLACVAGAREDRGKLLAGLLAGWALGFAFAAPFLLPFAEYVAHGHSYKHLARGLADHVVGRNIARFNFGPGIAGPTSLDAIRDVSHFHIVPTGLTFVAGTAAWVLACVAIVEGRIPGRWLLLAAVGLLLSFEPPKVDHYVADTFLLKDILPHYYWPLVMLPVALGAAAGTDALASGKRPLRALGIAAALFACLALAALGVSAFGTLDYTKPWAEMVTELPDPRPNVLRYHVRVLEALALAAGIAKLLHRRAAWAFTLIVTADVVLLMRPFLEEKPSSVLRRQLPAGIQRLARAAAAEHARLAGAAAGTSWAAWPMLARLPDIRMSAPLVPERYDAFLLAAGFDETDTQSCCAYSLPSAASQWAELAAVRYVVADAGQRAAFESDPQFTVAEKRPLSTVFENHRAFGRARLFFGATVAMNEMDASLRLRVLGTGGSHIDETALGKTVVLEPTRDAAPTSLDGAGSSDVTWIGHDPDEVVLSTDAPTEGYLMLADVYDPGWRATVDGAASPIFPADVGFRAVRVGAGRHVVRFVYRPASMWAGVGILVLASVLTGLGLRWSRRARAAVG